MNTLVKVNPVGNKVILNLTQHVATPEQVAAGVSEPANKEEVQRLLTFNTLPTREEVQVRAEKLAELAVGYNAAMIGGAPYLMGSLEEALRSKGIIPCYAFSVRESTEKTMPDGTVTKVAVFRHKGFVTM